MVGLINKRAIVQVLGCLLNKPDLLDTYYIEDIDVEEDFYVYILNTIKVLHKKNVPVIDAFAIDSYLSSYDAQYKVFSMNNGVDYIENAKKVAVLDNFDYNYQTLKKFTLLRYYDLKGNDIRFIYDPTKLNPKDQERETRKLDDYTIDDIIDLVELEMVTKPKLHFNTVQSEQGKLAGSGLKELKEKWKQEPEFGISLQSPTMNTIARGARLKKFYLRSGGTGSGKAIPNNEMIPTPNGFKKVEDIKVGDYLFGRDGLPTKVIGVHPQKEKKQVYEMTFSDGRIARCCKDHLWSYYYVTKVNGKRAEKLRTESVQEILERANSSIGGLRKDKGYRFKIPVNDAVHYTEKTLPIPPYVLGVMLGDGSFRKSKKNRSLYLSSEDDEIPEKIALTMGWTYKRSHESNYSYIFKDGYGVNVHIDEFLQDIPELVNTYSHNKFIPQMYLTASIKQRQELLQGLLDTDGYVDEKGRVSFTTTSEQLKDGIMELIRSLGYICTCSRDNRTHKYTNGVCYDISLQTSKEKKKQLFTLNKHLEKLATYFNTAQGKKELKHDKVAITSIKALDEYEDMTCFTVDNGDHLFLMNDYIVTHNTRLAVGDVCSYSIPWYYDVFTKEWKFTGFSEPALFITTELEAEEIQSLIVAFVSGVNESTILDGSYSRDEEERVDRAIQYIESSPLYIEHIDDFDINDIENLIKRYKKEKGVLYVSFDYIHTSVKLIMQIASMSKGMKLQEHQVLYMFAIKLKELCNKLGVHIDSSTQLNGEYKNARDKDETLLRGAKSIADKIDIGIISMPPTREELKAVEPILQDRGVSMTPNLIYHIYKVRRGKISRVRLWLHVDLGTCRSYDLFVTNNDNELIPVEQITIENVEQMLEENSVHQDDVPLNEEEREEAIGQFFFF